MLEVGFEYVCEHGLNVLQEAKVILTSFKNLRVGEKT